MASKANGSSLELGSTKAKKENENSKLKQRDVLVGMLVGYIVGIIIMMLIHFISTKKCTNCSTGDGNNELQTECAEGWIILAGEHTCFFESYFDVNWTVVEPEAGTNQIDQYFNQIEKLQDVDDDILIGTVFNNGRGFYQWVGQSPEVIPDTKASNSTDVCLSELQGTPSEWGINLDDSALGICKA